MHTGNAAYAKRMIAMGFDFVTVMNDIRLIMAAGQQAMKEMRA